MFSNSLLPFLSFIKQAPFCCSATAREYKGTKCCCKILFSKMKICKKKKKRKEKQEKGFTLQAINIHVVYINLLHLQLAMESEGEK